MHAELEAAYDGLFLAAEHGRTDVLKALLDHGKDVLKLELIRNTEGMTPLHVAVVHQKTDAVRALLSAGFAADTIVATGTKKCKYVGKTAYEIACGQLPNAAMVQVFIQYVVQYVAMNDVEKVEMLLRAGIDGASVNDGPPHENTLLHWAASTNAVDVLTLLLDKYVDTKLVDLCNGDGATALHEACHMNHAQCVQILVNHGADLSIVGTRGYCKGKTPVEVTSNKDIIGIIAKGKIIQNSQDKQEEIATSDAEHDQIVALLSPKKPVSIPTPPPSTSSSYHHDSVRLQLEEKDALIAQLKESVETLVTDANDRQILGDHAVVLEYIRKLRLEKETIERQLRDTQEYVIVQEEQMMELKAQIRCNFATIETLQAKVHALESNNQPPTSQIEANSSRHFEQAPVPAQPYIADVFDYASVHARALAEPESFWQTLLHFLWPFGKVDDDAPADSNELIMTV